VLLLERADHPGFWQSVTGSLERPDEPLADACTRETLEETGFAARPEAFEDWRQCNRYAIYAHWRNRYAAGVTHNEEHVFGLTVAAAFEPRLSAREHTGFAWLDWRTAADACFSWTNAQAIRLIAERGGVG